MSTSEQLPLHSVLTRWAGKIACGRKVININDFECNLDPKYSVRTHTNAHISLEWIIPIGFVHLMPFSSVFVTLLSVRYAISIIINCKRALTKASSTTNSIFRFDYPITEIIFTVRFLSTVYKSRCSAHVIGIHWVQGIHTHFHKSINNVL